MYAASPAASSVPVFELSHPAHWSVHPGPANADRQSAPWLSPRADAAHLKTHADSAPASLEIAPLSVPPPPVFAVPATPAFDPEIPPRPPPP